jgi:hypothetical protein
MIKGFIYSIQHRTDANCKQYIGSSMIDLNERLREHKNDFGKYLNGKTRYYTSSFELFKDYGKDNFKIVPLTQVEVETKEELKRIEGEYIKNCPNRINKKVAGRSQSEYQRERVICPHCNKNYARCSMKKHSKKCNNNIV